MSEFRLEAIFISIILVLFLAGSGAALFQTEILNPAYIFSQGSSIITELYHNIVNARMYALYQSFLSFLAVFFITVICYCAIRMFEIRKKEHAHHHQEIHEYAKRHGEGHDSHGVVAVSENQAWNKVLTYLSSDSSSDWKLAIIEADTLLEGMMKDLGFQGQSLGDRLKMASQETFKGLSSAWEVHNIRNRIAHEGLAFELSKHEANRIIAIYESIFRNYGFI